MRRASVHAGCRVPGRVPEVWLTLLPPIPLGTTAMPLARMRGSQATRTAHSAVVQFGRRFDRGVILHPAARSARRGPRLRSHMEPRPAVILDDLIEIVQRNGCGPSQQAPPGDDQQIFQQQHALRSSPFSLLLTRTVLQAVAPLLLPAL